MGASARGLLVTTSKKITCLNTNKQGKHPLKKGGDHKLNANQRQNRAWVTYVGHAFQSEDQETYLIRMNALMGTQACVSGTDPLPQHT